MGFGKGDEVCGDTDGGGEGVQVGEFVVLVGVLGDDPFFRVAVRDGVFGAEGVEFLAAGKAEVGL